VKTPSRFIIPDDLPAACGSGIFCGHLSMIEFRVGLMIGLQGMVVWR
jgi:hypothetical protein